jgi:leucyl aminopeptidase
MRWLPFRRLPRKGISKMRFTTSTRPLADESLDAIAVPVFSGGIVPVPALRALGQYGDGLPALAARLGLREAGSHWWVSTRPSGPDLLLTCVGPASDAGATEDGLRVAAMTTAKAADRQRVASLLTAGRPSDSDSAITVTESWVMGAYQFNRYRTDDRPAACEEIVMWGCDPAQVERGLVFGEAASSARDLINTPAGDLPPLALADRCRDLASAYGFAVNVHQGQALEDGGFGGLLAVGAGSINPPVLIELERGRRDLPHLALVGKGITFDSGGLSLKSTRDMQTMKADMAGAASIIGALIAAERLGAETHVRAYLACAENMPDGAAVRVGDIVRHRNGLTTEVIDTDCEGRLVLSDALTFAAEHRPTHIVDIATLAATTGLGPDLWAVLGTDASIVRQLLDAGTASGEPGWQLPLWDGYAGRLRSDVADLRNYDPTITQPFGAVLAALYLRHFVGGLPWAHIDLGLTVMRTEATAAWRPGANGNGTRTLARYLAKIAPAGTGSGSVHPGMAP